MTSPMFLTVMVFLAATSAVLLVFMLLNSRKTRVSARMEKLDTWLPAGAKPKPVQPTKPPSLATVTRSTLPKVGSSMVPHDEAEKSRLQAKLHHAGLYNRQAMPMFLGAKLILMVGPALVGTLLGIFGLVPTQTAFMAGGCLGILGMIGPSFWLDMRKAKNQDQLRRSMPDAMDLIVICLEGGLSFQAAVRRVSAELQQAHPLLCRELNIVQREIQLGQDAGESFQRMGVRTDLEEIRNLSAVITQSQRFGASLVKALKAHAENLRLLRQQAAEERAQQAAVKILIPTLICIFPAIFVVILGPAMFRLARSFSN